MSPLVPRDNNTRYCEFLRIIDGDTFQARIVVLPHVRPRVEVVASIRVYNWNAAEMDTEEGRVLRVKFEELLMHAKRIDLQIKTMSFERIVAAVWLDDELFAGILTHELLALRSARAEHSRTTGGTDPAAGHPDEPAASGVDPVDHDDDHGRGQEPR